MLQASWLRRGLPPAREAQAKFIFAVNADWSVSKSNCIKSQTALEENL